MDDGEAMECECDEDKDEDEDEDEENDDAVSVGTEPDEDKESDQDVAMSNAGEFCCDVCQVLFRTVQSLAFLIEGVCSGVDNFANTQLLPCRPPPANDSQMEYEDDDQVNILPCKHFFHTDCVSRWLKVRTALYHICLNPKLQSQGDLRYVRPCVIAPFPSNRRPLARTSKTSMHSVGSKLFHTFGPPSLSTGSMLK